jgi:ribosome-binding protein aMBF1 (putative translation factor)
MSRTPAPDLALAHAVTAMRAERGLSREALALRSRATPHTVDRIERAEILPRWDTVRRLARGLDISLTELSEAVERSEAAIEAGAQEGPAA